MTDSTVTLRVYTVAEREPPEGKTLLVWSGDYGSDTPIVASAEADRYGVLWTVAERADPVHYYRRPTDLWAEIPEVPHE